MQIHRIDDGESPQRRANPSPRVMNRVHGLGESHALRVDFEPDRARLQQPGHQLGRRQPVSGLEVRGDRQITAAAILPTAASISSGGVISPSS